MMKTIEGYTYKINENIGKGYSSTVHKGIKDLTGEEVAIKVIEMVKLEDPINQMLLQHQITALKYLTNSNYVLHLYDVYATKNNTYIITELCQGDLASMMKSRRIIPYHQAVDILKQIISGYNDVHNIGYLHRDIKPANVFYRRGIYKLGDFGFAIPKHQLDKHKDYNVGSPVYMPPEALKDNLYSVSSDTWAIGVIFYQMIKGVVPWRAVSEQALHKKMISEPLDQLTIGLPEVARLFLSKVLNLDPSKRMTIQEMRSWPARLMNFDSNSKNQLPLKQIKFQNNILPHDHSETNLRKNQFTPKQAPNRVLFFQQPVPSMKNIHSQNEKKNYFSKSPSYQNQQPIIQKPVEKHEIVRDFMFAQDNEKPTKVLAENMLNYLKFMHKTLKFVGSPTQVYLEDLEEALKCSLINQVANFREYFKNPSSCSLAGWQQFLESATGKQFHKKFNKIESKYRMFHAPKNQDGSLGEQLLKAGIFALLQNLETETNFNEKSVIAADYLTTLYQLWDLKDKYTLNQFLKKSKLDLILKGNPYNASKENLENLRKKVSLIDLFN